MDEHLTAHLCRAVHCCYLVYVSFHGCFYTAPVVHQVWSQFYLNALWELVHECCIALHSSSWTHFHGKKSTEERMWNSTHQFLAVVSPTATSFSGFRAQTVSGNSIREPLFTLEVDIQRSKYKASVGIGICPAFNRYANRLGIISFIEKYQKPFTFWEKSLWLTKWMSTCLMPLLRSEGNFTREETLGS